MTDRAANQYALAVTYGHAVEQVRAHCRTVDRFERRSEMEYVFEAARVDSKRAEHETALAVAWLGRMGLLLYPARAGQASPNGISEERFRVLPYTHTGDGE